MKTYKFSRQGFEQARMERLREENYRAVVKKVAALTVMGTLFVTAQTMAAFTLPAYIPSAELFESTVKAFGTVIKISGV